MQYQKDYKDKYGYIYKVSIDGTDYQYRTLTVGEYRDMIRAATDDASLEDSIVMAALLYPEIDYDSICAGIITVLCNYILSSSNLSDKNTWQDTIDDRKKGLLPRRDTSTGELVVDDPIIPIIIGICRVFPSYKPDDLLAMTVNELLDRAAWAEVVMRATDNTTNTDTNIPPGLPADQRKKLLERISAERSERALRDEMSKSKGVNKTNAKPRS